MPVDVKRITDERLQGWAKQLVNVHATPVLLLGVGHDHVSGQVHIVVTENMTPAQIRAFLKAALRDLDK